MIEKKIFAQKKTRQKASTFNAALRGVSQRVLATVMSVVLAVGMLPALSWAENTTSNATEVWDGTSTSEPTKNEEGSYVIKTANELAWFMSAASEDCAYAGNAILANNIDLGTLSSWYTPGLSSKSDRADDGRDGYQGTFDGNGHSITVNYAKTGENVNTIVSLFYFIGTNGVVENLTVEGSFSATVTGLNNMREAHAASIVYYNYGTVKNCANKATIQSTSPKSYTYAAGIACWNAGTLEQCANYGSISSISEGTLVRTFAGGITSYIRYPGNNTEQKVQIKSCYNSGAITTSFQPEKPTNTTYYAVAGGIVGYAMGYFDVQNCLNTGTICATNTTDPSITNCCFDGGVMGGIWFGSSYSASQRSVTNCFYLEGTASSTCVSMIVKSNTAAVEKNCGAATSENVSSAGWITENLGSWFNDILGVYFDEVTVYADNAFVSVAPNDGTAADVSATPLYLISVKASNLAEGSIPIVSNTEFVKDGDFYKTLVLQDVANAVKEGTTKVSITKGTAATTPTLKGDVNMGGTLTIVDAQIAYDMACACYNTSTAAIAEFLAADVNADNVLNALDARAIQHALHLDWDAADENANVA